ncbi:MAG TPA: hypothetical protein VF138_12380 [Caulobacteraceae bacterium]
MIDLKPSIRRIEALLEEGTEPSVTYAALEARLALERAAYDRVRQCHDYISHADLKRWQPSGIVNTLLAEVDQHAGSSRTLYISKNPAIPGVKPSDDDYVKIGTEEGFDPKLVGKLWNALAKLALHIKIPESRDDNIPAYGDKDAIVAKVREALKELERLSATTMTFSGFGEEVSFKCVCGVKNKRRAALLREGQVVACINPDCKRSWKVSKDGDEFGFEAQIIEIDCEKCNEANGIPWRWFLDMRFDQTGSFSCRGCRHKNYVQWRLTQVRPGKHPPSKLQRREVNASDQ